MASIKFFKEDNLPLEMHKVRIVQKLNLIPIEQRLNAINEAGNNTFLLKNRDVFLDMLTDSGTNAMSDRQLAAMMIADDSYAGSETYYRLERQAKKFFNKIWRCKYGTLYRFRVQTLPQRRSEAVSQRRSLLQRQVCN